MFLAGLTQQTQGKKVRGDGYVGRGPAGECVIGRALLPMSSASEACLVNVSSSQVSHPNHRKLPMTPGLYLIRAACTHKEKPEGGRELPLAVLPLWWTCAGTPRLLVERTQGSSLAFTLALCRTCATCLIDKHRLPMRWGPGWASIAWAEAGLH